MARPEVPLFGEADKLVENQQVTNLIDGFIKQAAGPSAGEAVIH